MQRCPKGVPGEAADHLSSQVPGAEGGAVRTGPRPARAPPMLLQVMLDKPPALQRPGEPVSSKSQMLAKSSVLREPGTGEAGSGACLQSMMEPGRKTPYSTMSLHCPFLPRHNSLSAERGKLFKGPRPRFME